jgi:hypothetical protein
MQEARDALIEEVGRIAERYGVCPTCLMYAAADMVADAEERGVIGHIAMDGDGDEEEPEEEDHGLAAMPPLGRA